MTLGFLAIVMTLGNGDIHLPEKVTDNAPCMLLIHGGGWGAMCRKDVVGIADWASRDLGMVVYNIDYRLASKSTPWPACGNDCVAAAKFMFSDAFARAAGVRPKEIWVLGGSAGGHLALWTGLSLPAEKVAGIVSISGIADPVPDAARDPRRYRTLFGGEVVTRERLESMNPIGIVRSNGPRVLCTHAREDEVVPIESARSFAETYRAAGNRVEFFEYSKDCRPGLTGHCIWVPGSNPHDLIPELKDRIRTFIRAVP